MSVLALLWAMPAALLVFTAYRLVQARRTRRQTVDALQLVPELAGAVPRGTGDVAASVAEALARRLGGDPVTAATAARLAAVDPAVLTDSGISPQIARMVRNAANAPSGHALGTVAVVRVAHGYARRVGAEGSQPSGALFSTLVAHAAGDERQAAEALVDIMQGGLSPA